MPCVMEPQARSLHSSFSISSNNTIFHSRSSSPLPLMGPRTWWMLQTEWSHVWVSWSNKKPTPTKSHSRMFGVLRTGWTWSSRISSESPSSIQCFFSQAGSQRKERLFNTRKGCREKTETITTKRFRNHRKQGGRTTEMFWCLCCPRLIKLMSFCSMMMTFLPLNKKWSSSLTWHALQLPLHFGCFCECTLFLRKLSSRPNMHPKHSDASGVWNTSWFVAECFGFQNTDAWLFGRNEKKLFWKIWIHHEPKRHTAGDICPSDGNDDSQPWHPVSVSRFLNRPRDSKTFHWSRFKKLGSHLLQ